MASRPQNRPRFGAWTYRFGFSVVVLQYGMTVGFLANPRNPDYRPVRFFRNVAYRGLR